MTQHILLIDAFRKLGFPESDPKIIDEEAKRIHKFIEDEQRDLDALHEAEQELEHTMHNLDNHLGADTYAETELPN